ncbi:MAG: tRNA glutamyl-Q synthetase [Flavobacteriales bacterium]|nr:tRNA glutamyl-Q synthetase [Flavobacteriales bacterium]
MPQLPNIPTGRTRLAPTPSGYLHVGNAFNFLLTERLARSSGSRLLLRIDDLDQERVRPEYIEDIFRSLEWLGITWDEGPSGPDDFQRNWSQRLRLEKYRALAARLRSAGHTYACVCSRAQLEALRSTGEEHACRNGPVVMGRVASVRLRIPDPCPVRIMELSGAQTVDLHHEMPDPVMEQRGTGRPAYQLTSLCDDVAYGVTFLVRGRDLWPSTVCQIHVAQCLGLRSFTAIRTLHHPLVMDAEGAKLSKSTGVTSLVTLRGSGVGPDGLRRSVDRFIETGVLEVSP